MVCLFNFLALSGYLTVCEFRLPKPACVKKNILIPRSEKSTGFCALLKPEFSTLGHQTPGIDLTCHETNLKLHSTDHTDRELIIYSEGGQETSFLFPTCLPRLCSEGKLNEKESRVLSLYNFVWLLVAAFQPDQFSLSVGVYGTLDFSHLHSFRPPKPVYNWDCL